MSLGEKTKCDLSAGIAKLDLTVLTKQTENHFYSLMGQLGRKVNEITANSMKKEDRKEQLLSMAAHGAKGLCTLTDTIAEVTELLHTLYNTDDREIEIIKE